MLTQSELAWLNERQICLACEGNYIWGWYWEDGVELETMQEAAEFEAQVAAKLAKFFKSYVKSSVCADLENNTLCPGWPVCTEDVSKPHPPCDFSIMKGVRLEVEEEMDGEKDNS